MIALNFKIIICSVFIWNWFSCTEGFFRRFNNRNNKADQEDSNLRLPALCIKYGYESESHQVESQDGYLLLLHRIPRPDKPPVVLFHGILGSSKEWFLPIDESPKSSLGFLLADADFDVWIFNTRGNHYSQGHKNLSLNSKDFWDFSIDEQAEFDVPATIDYILKTTNKNKLSFIGYSLGTFLFVRGMAENPIYNEKINLFIGYAPAASLGNMSSPIVSYLSRFANPEQPLKSVLDIIGNGKILPLKFQPYVKTLWKLFCGNSRLLLCNSIMYMYSGYSPGKINNDIWDIFLGEAPSVTSSRTLVQLLQWKRVNESKAIKYDYGIEANLFIYGNESPPVYDMKLVTAPSVLFSGANDALVDFKDTDWLAGQLPNVIENIRVNFPGTWAHPDFFLARDAKELVYIPTINYLKKYSQDI